MGVIRPTSTVLCRLLCGERAILATFMFVDSAFFTGAASLSNRSLRRGRGREGEGRGRRKERRNAHTYLAAQSTCHSHSPPIHTPLTTHSHTSTIHTHYNHYTHHKCTVDASSRTTNTLGRSWDHSILCMA